MVRELTIIAAAALIIASLAAHAQSTPSKLTYRCVGKDGKKYYGSTVPMPCLGLPIEQLNTSGMVVKRIDPDNDEKKRPAKQAEAKKKRQVRPGQAALPGAHRPQVAQPESLRRGTRLTSSGSALPCVAFMTCPTRELKAFSLPAR